MKLLRMAVIIYTSKLSLVFYMLLPFPSKVALLLSTIYLCLLLVLYLVFKKMSVWLALVVNLNLADKHGITLIPAYIHACLCVEANYQLWERLVS